MSGPGSDGTRPPRTRYLRVVRPGAAARDSALPPLPPLPLAPPTVLPPWLAAERAAEPDAVARREGDGEGEAPQPGSRDGRDGWDGWDGSRDGRDGGRADAGFAPHADPSGGSGPVAAPGREPAAAAAASAASAVAAASAPRAADVLTAGGPGRNPQGAGAGYGHAPGGGLTSGGGYGLLDDLQPEDPPEIAQLRRRLREAVEDVEPAADALDRLRSAVPQRRARKRQARIAAAAVLALGLVSYGAVSGLSGSSGGGVESAQSGATPGSSAPASHGHGGHGVGGEAPDGGSAVGGLLINPLPGSGPGSGLLVTVGPSADGSDPSQQAAESLVAGAAPCTRGQLGGGTSVLGTATASGLRYGSFRVVNVSAAPCVIRDAGTVEVLSAVDPAQVTVVAHRAGDPATALPPAAPTQRPIALLPGGSYVVEFAWVPSASCGADQTGGGTGGGTPSASPSTGIATGGSGAGGSTGSGGGTTTGGDAAGGTGAVGGDGSGGTDGGTTGSGGGSGGDATGGTGSSGATAADAGDGSASVPPQNGTVQDAASPPAIAADAVTAPTSPAGTGTTGGTPSLVLGTTPASGGPAVATVTVPNACTGTVYRTDALPDTSN